MRSETTRSHLAGQAADRPDDPEAHATHGYLLLIEDNPGDVHLLSAAFSELESPLAVHAVANVRDAVLWLRGEGPRQSRTLPRLILLDLTLPGANGLMALIRLKATDAWRTIPVVVLTGVIREAERSDCLRHGAVGFHAKPRSFSGYLSFAQDMLTSFVLR